MLPPEIIDRQRREREEDRPSLELPLHPPAISPRDLPLEDEEEQTARHVVIIDLA
jgi:hypothetical protein